MKKFILGGVVLCLVLYGAYYIQAQRDDRDRNTSVVQESFVVDEGIDVLHDERVVIVADNSDEQIQQLPETKKDQEKVFPTDQSLSELPRKIKNDVAFTAQAPSAQWDNPLYQDACEEASLLMAARWARGETSRIGKKEAEQEFEKMFAFEQENYGNAFDTSAVDTAMLMQEYFTHDATHVFTVTTPDDIVHALAQGNLVVVPADGQKLHNPYFSAPGPERHMLVITGYDLKKQEFITNDPGTRRGEDFRYPFDILFGALRDYPSGHKKPIVNEVKRMIVVGRS